MDPKIDLPDLVEDLEVNIDELTETLSPLLETSLSTSASSLPLLDKAKLYVLAAYSIESLLYSTLSASGVNAKEHAVFRELGRLKGYFGKIKDIEERDTNASSQQPKQKLDVGAAARFIRHGLAGNEKYDLERAERMAKERARAKLKAAKINKKFNDAGEEVTTPKKRPAEEATPELPRGDEEFSDTELIEGFEDPGSHTTKKQKLSSPQASDPSLETPDPTKKPDKRNKKNKNKSSDTSEPEPEADAEHDNPTDQNKKKRKKSSKKEQNAADVGVVQAQGNHTPEQSKKGKGRPKKK